MQLQYGAQDHSWPAVPKPSGTFGLAAPLTLKNFRLLSEIPQNQEQSLGYVSSREEGEAISFPLKSTYSIRSQTAPGYLWQ